MFSEKGKRIGREGVGLSSDPGTILDGIPLRVHRLSALLGGRLRVVPLLRMVIGVFV